MEYCRRLAAELRAVTYHGRPLEVEVDDRDIRGGEKTWGWIKKGVPLRVEIGPRDIASDSVFVGRRDRDVKDKQSLGRATFVATATEILDEMQAGLLARAKAFRTANTRIIDDKDEFYAFFTPADADKPEIHGGFAMAHYSGEPELEDRIARDLNVTVRCIPLGGQAEPRTCIFTGKPSARRVVFAKAY